ncbi:uncharacterized protein LOC129773628 [Toxorhynchites rutilus septentrionalis]|uniref:uncharacterized protein LOC129773628 n=1 Tax=Toxorhynchites rutilus septentrionalis TaxID=329112 RepID=UPI00247A6617|nr:uncharacterized protein LOC129773628 [Toxorhynchites rutilus septentrionalis]
MRNFDPDEHGHEIPLRLERLEKLMESFETVQSEYEEFDADEYFTLENAEIRAKVEEKYFQVKAGLLVKHSTQQLPVASTSTQAIPAQLPFPNPLSNVKLPTITLPEFDGDFNGWLTFHDTFLSMIHSSTEISSVQKFHYVRAALKGEAANLIHSITITAANYSVAWDTLIKRYSNKSLLRKKHIRALLKYPKIPNGSLEALHRIFDDFQRHTKVLQQLGEPVEQFSSILIELLVDKLDDASHSAWEESIASDENPTYEKMVEFLQKRTRVLETIMVNRPSPSQSKTGNHNSGIQKQNASRVSSNAMAESVNKEYPLCPACEKQRHSLMDCLLFNEMNIQDRLRVVNDKKLCSNCFRSDHFARTCRSKFVCKQCTKRHHTMIHPGYIEVQLHPEPKSETTPKTENEPLPGPSRVVSAIATTETLAADNNAHVAQL